MIAAAQPQATWLERHIDLGVFKEANGKVNCKMRLVNTGNEPLLIVKAQAGCGCTAVSYTEAPIPPGDTASVSITYNPAGRPGQFTKQVLVFTNSEPRRTILEISGNAIPTEATLNKMYPLRAGSLRISQQNMPMGEIVRGKSKTEFLSAYNASTDTLLVTATGAPTHLKPAVVPDTVPPARVTALTVHYLSDYAPQWGLNSDTIRLTGKPLRQPSTAVEGSADVMVMAQVIENFDHLTDKQRRNAPVVAVDCGDRLDYGTLVPGQVVARSFTITNKGKDPLEIRRTWVPDGEGITISANKATVKRSKTATVTVRVDTSHLTDELLNVPLTLMTNDPDTPRLTIRLVGIIDRKQH